MFEQNSKVNPRAHASIRGAVQIFNLYENFPMLLLVSLFFLLIPTYFELLLKAREQTVESLIRLFCFINSTDMSMGLFSSNIHGIVNLSNQSNLSCF